MNYFKHFNILLLLLLLSGCAANIQEDLRKPILMSNNTTAQQIHLDTSHSTHIPMSTDLVDVAAELKQLISRKYSGATYDVSLEKVRSNEGIGVYISIEHLKYVSSAGRFMIGVFAGDAELRLSVKLIELSSGRVLGESILDTRSKKSEGIFGATTSRQLEAVAQKIVADVRLSETSG